MRSSVCALISLLALAGCGSSGGDSSSANPKSSGKNPPVPTSDETDELDPAGFSSSSLAAGFDNQNYERPVIDCAANPLGGSSSIGVSVANTRGMATAERAREVLLSGRAPVPDAIVPRDFINYYAPHDPAPAAFSPILQVKAKELSDPSGAPVFIGQYDVLVGLEAPKTTRGPLGLVVLVDDTPSVGQKGLLAEQNVLRTLSGSLISGDHVSVLRAVSTDPLLEIDVSQPADGEQLGTIAGSLSLGADELTLRDPIGRAYDHAEQLSKQGLATRVLVLSDGDNDPNDLDTTRIQTDAAPGPNPILLIAVNTGAPSGYRTRMLRKASKAGRGAYVYISDQAEAERLFGARFGELVGIAADSVSIDLKLPGGFAVYGDIEDLTTNLTPAKSDNYVSPGMSLVFLLKLIACDVSNVPTSAGFALELGFSEPGQTAPTALQAGNTIELLAAGDHTLLDKALLVDQYANAIRSSDLIRLTAARDALHAALAAGATDPDIQEMAHALDAHPAFSH